MDRAFPYHLQRNVRRAIRDIADAVDVSNNTIHTRMQDMEAAGIITGYSVDVVILNRQGLTLHPETDALLVAI